MHFVNIVTMYCVLVVCASPASLCQWPVWAEPGPRAISLVFLFIMSQCFVNPLFFGFPGTCASAAGVREWPVRAERGPRADGGGTGTRGQWSCGHAGVQAPEDRINKQGMGGTFLIRNNALHYNVVVWVVGPVHISYQNVHKQSKIHVFFQRFWIIISALDCKSLIYMFITGRCDKVTCQCC